MPGFLANVNFRYMLSPRPSVCRLSSVTLVRSTQVVQIFGNIFYGIWYLGQKIYGDRPRGTPPPGKLNTRPIAKYILDLSKDISRKRCKIGGKLV